MAGAAALLGLACSMLLGCAAVTGQASVEVATPPESEALVALPPLWGPQGAGSRVRYHDRNEIEEYAAYGGAGARAELLYAAATDDRYALEDRFNIAGALDVFAYPRQRARALGASEAAAVGLITVFHRRFELAADQRQCVGLKASWDDVAYDPRRRPAKLLLGYYCAAPNAPLDDAAIERLIEGLRIAKPPDTRPQATPPEARDALLREARGGDPGSAGDFAEASAEAARGVSDFPLGLARRYQDVDKLGALELIE